MGNTPSTNTRPTTSTSQAHSHSSSPSGHTSNDSSRTSSTRRDPRNLIQAQRTAARAEPSLAQAHGSNVTHRPRTSQSYPAAQFNSSSPASAVNTPPVQDRDTQSGVQVKDELESEKIDIRDQPTKPVDVPMSSSNYDSKSSRSHSDSLSRSQSQSIDPSGPPLQDMSYHITRPPRLPLPIEEEVHTPGSPIIAPTDDINAPVLDIEALDNEQLPRRNSALSNTTVDEEDAAELDIDKTKATVPTTFEWREGGEKVYVTGTIFQWNKKHRLHPVEGEPGFLRSIVHVKPGTHHVRFIVDGAMKCSTLLPTTVDFGNNLVNYIEVSADDLPRVEPPPDIPSDPIGGAAKPEIAQAEPATTEEAAKPKPKMKPVEPDAQYTSQIPQYLVDMDKSEDSTAYKYAMAAIEKLPSPPSLPGFLGKPILNAATPMKDDNSVLTMPNHTVLNHLATSSIKNSVLAVSATTRYKRKYVTTIMYKPTGEDKE